MTCKLTQTLDNFHLSMLFISSSWKLSQLKIICLGRRGKKQKDKKTVKEYVNVAIDDEVCIFDSKTKSPVLLVGQILK